MRGLGNLGAEVGQEGLKGVLLRGLGSVVARPVLGIGAPRRGIDRGSPVWYKMGYSHGKGTILSAIRGERC